MMGGARKPIYERKHQVRHNPRRSCGQDAKVEQMLAGIKKANEQMARDQQEIEALQAETRAIIARLKEPSYMETTF